MFASLTSADVRLELLNIAPTIEREVASALRCGVTNEGLPGRVLCAVERELIHRLRELEQLRNGECESPSTDAK